MSQSKQILTEADFFKFQWLQGAKFSPDGKKIVYSISHISADKDKKEKEFISLYLLDVASGNTRKLTSGKAQDVGAVWSPDGSTLAFTSDRSGKNQLYLLPVDGGEAQQLTDLPQGANNPVWSPDGKMIAFIAGIDWGDNTPDHLNEPYRITRNVWRFDAIGDLDLAVNNIYVVDVESQATQQLTDSPLLKSGLQWSHDGTKILFSANMKPDSFTALFPDVLTVDLDGNVTPIITDWETFGVPFWAPDGKKIVVIGRKYDGAPIGTHVDLWVFDPETGEFDNRTPTLERGISGGLEGFLPTQRLGAVYIGFSPDGKSAYTRVQIGGTVQLMRIALEGPEAHEVVVGGDRLCILLDIHENTLLFAADDITHTPDLYTAQLDGSQETQRTHINDTLLETFALPEFENLHFKGSDGVDVEGWYLKPTNGAQAPYPTILWIHGGPHGAQGFHFAFDALALTGAGYGVIYVNHRASTGYGNAFSTAIKGDWGNLDYKDLMAGVDYAIELGLADADKLGCTGISGGGNLSCWIIGNTDRFKAAVPQNPVTNWQSFYGVSDIGVWFGVEQMGGHPHELPEVYDRCSPITYAHNCKTPTLLIQAEHDWRCPPEQSEQFYTVLKANGCIVEMQRHPKGSHGSSLYGALALRKSHLQSRRTWFDQYILGKTDAE